MIRLHFIKNIYLRWKNGVGCCDIQNLDDYLARKIIKPLKVFKKHREGGCPADIKSYEEWEKALDEMIWAFEHIIKDEGTFEERMSVDEREQKGLELFGKYFRNLWI